MKCPKCGKESSGKFCQHCGAKLDDTSSLNKNQSYNYNPTEQPKKKNKGCLIAVIVVVQKFLNKWTIFLFCSILFSSNQKEH